MKKPVIGLVLGGGGARGLAHIGVLKVLEQHNIPIHVLAGTSMGGLVAAAFATGLNANELEEHAIHTCQTRQLIKLMDISPSRRGLLEGNRVKSHLLNWLGDNLFFENLRIPLSLTAVDLHTSQEHIFDHGQLLPAIFSTIAVPGVFAPVPFENKLLVDGGVLDNLPLLIARKMGADILIAVDVQIDPQRQPVPQTLPSPFHLPRHIQLPELIRDFYWSLLIMSNAQTQQQISRAKPEILIKPNIPPDVDMFLSFTKAPQLIQLGEQAATEALPLIHQVLNKTLANYF